MTRFRDAALASAGITLEELRANAPEIPRGSRSEAVEDTKEFRRIVGLPRRSLADLDPSLVSDMTRAFKRPSGTMALRPIQALALKEIHEFGGLFAPMRVGSGKTLVSYLAPLFGQCRRPLLLVPAKLKDKTYREFRELSRHWENPPILRIESYELLGRPQAADMLSLYLPDMLICDEAHKLKNPRAAVTRRVRRYIEEHTTTKVVAMSGTITKRSLRDYSHVIHWCLPRSSPVPHTYNDLEMWADALDEKINPLRRVLPGALGTLCEGDERVDLACGGARALSGVRRAYRRRLVDTPGVVATQEGPSDMGLTIEPLFSGSTDSALDDAFEKLNETWETPSGEPISDGITKWRIERQLGLGMYYTWFDHGRFAECLTKTLKKRELTLPSIVREIVTSLTKSAEQHTKKTLRVFASETMLTALATQKSVVQPKNSETNVDVNTEYGKDSSLSTVSHQSSIKNYTTHRADCALSAKSEAMVRNAWQSIIATKQGPSEGCYALCVTERLAHWVTMLRELPGLCSILKEACDYARAPEDWLNPRKDWSAWCRQILQHNQLGLDSEAQVALAVDRGQYNDLGRLARWRAVRPSFEPNPVGVWLSSEALDAAERWLAGPGKAGIVWVEHVEFAKELQRRTRLPYYGRGGLDASGTRIEDHGTGPMIASVASNSEGRNLQKWSTNLVMCAPPNGGIWEQLLGRTHRDGQEADEVTVHLYAGCVQHIEGFWQARRDSEYTQDTTGQAQKLMYADITVPRPEALAGPQRKGARWVRTAR